jgi:hypothetical protein
MLLLAPIIYDFYIPLLLLIARMPLGESGRLVYPQFNGVIVTHAARLTGRA